MRKYTDSIDVTTTISLYEYGYIRNPKTGKTICCLNAGLEHNKDNPPIIKTTFISLEDVEEAIEEAPNGYFSFIGSDKETELKELNNEYLTWHIMTLNMYHGAFDYIFYGG